MNAPLRKIGVVLLIMFGLLFANLTWVQGYQANEYRTSEFNGRVQIAEYQRQRGRIVIGDTVIADTQKTNGELTYLRTYPGGKSFAHLVGYKPVGGAATGIERVEDLLLAGTSDKQFADRLKEIFTGKKTAGATVHLALSKAGQDAAVQGLAGNSVRAGRGAVVAIDPKTGALLAMASMPDFDPTPLVSHDFNVASPAYQALEKNASKPLLNRATSETFPPGSTMKVLVSAAALQKGVPPETVLAGGASYQAPDTSHVIGNAPGVNCPAQITLKQALTVSCNTAFSRLGVEQIGADGLRQMAEAFGFEVETRFAEDQDTNVYRTAPSHTGDLKDPDGSDNAPKVAQSCIGQADVRMTPLQGALMAAAVANGGKQMRPYLVQKVTGPDLSTLENAEPKVLRTPINGSVAGDLSAMMVNVVQSGTGRAARVSGFTVGGKTGTAENGETAGDHGWFIGFIKKNDEPIAAVAVLLEGAGRGGSAEAAKIAGSVMRAIATERGLR